MEARASETGPGEVGTREVVPLQAHAREISARKVHAVQDRAIKARALEIGAGEIGPGEVAPVEIGPCKIAAATIDGLLRQERGAIRRWAGVDRARHRRHQNRHCDESEPVHAFLLPASGLRTHQGAGADQDRRA